MVCYWIFQYVVHVITIRIKIKIFIFPTAPNVSLKIEVDPNHPRIFPSITWLGSETAVFVFREKILDRVEVRLFYYLIFFLIFLIINA